MSDTRERSESDAAQRLAEETNEPRERFAAADKPLPGLDELEPVTDGGVDQGESEADQYEVVVRADGGYGEDHAEMVKGRLLRIGFYEDVVSVREVENV